MLTPGDTGRFRRHEMQVPLGLTIATLMLDIEREWTPSRSLPKSSALSASSQCRMPDRWARATSRLRIEDMTKCWLIAHGFGCGSSTAFAAEVSRQ
jgi:hypothetical protein